ncbi:MAG: HEAT repeat domain-containing protein [Anaerolineae bacterium]|nr:HEAT repeat domain-containing protein [Anaerolineae bacterium]
MNMDEAEIKAVMKQISAAWWNRQLIDEDLIKAVRLPEVMEVLIKELGNEDFSVRKDAGFALAELVGEDAKAELVKALSNDRWQARAEAASELWHYKDPQLTQYLVLLLHDSELPVRLAAASSLSMMSDPASVPHLIAAIEDSKRNMFDDASEALYMIAEEHEIPELFPYLKSENVQLRIAAAYALGAKGGKDAVRGLIDLVEVGISGDKPEYERARDQLQLIGEPAVEALIEVLDKRDEVLSQLAIEVLAPIGDLRALPHIIAAMSDEDDQIYETATWGASEFGKAAIPLLLDLLKSENPRLRGNAADALGKIQDARVIENLAVLLNDEDAEVRRKLLFALYDLGDVSAVHYLLPLLHGPAQDEKNNRTTAGYAAQVLKFKLSTPEALEAVERWKKEEGVKGF